MKGFTISDEFALVIACCRWPLTADDLIELRRRAETPIEWGRLMTLTKRHRVAGLVRRALHATGIALPNGVSSTLAEQSRQIAAQNLRLASESLYLQQQFERAGIPILMLKGVSLAKRVYGTIAFKHGRDIDLLVQPVHALAALRLLESDGYSLVAPATTMSDRQRRAFVDFGFETELFNSVKGVRVELHWRLSENPWLISNVDGLAATQNVQVAEANVRTLTDANLFIYLCVHGAKHFWFRLKWLADLNALLSQIPDSEIPKLYAHAQVHGAGLCAAQTLLLCQNLFKRPLPQSINRELIENRRAQRLAGYAIRNLIAPDPPAENSLSWHAGQFLLGRGVRFLASQFALTLTTNADVLRWPLPRQLSVIYWIMRGPSFLLRRLHFQLKRIAAPFSEGAKQQ